MHADLSPHEGLVFLDECAVEQCCKLTHIVTGECVELELGPYALAFESDGFGYLVKTGEAGEPETPLEDIFTQQLATTGHGEQVALRLRPGGAPDIQHLGLAHAEFDLRRLHMRIGATRQLHQLPVAVFRLPRAGFRVFFSLVGIYNALNLTMFKGVASRWAWQSIPAFARIMAPVATGQVLRSQAYQDTGADTPDKQRCLPFHAISSAAFVVLLCRWSGSSGRRGGMRDQAAQQAAAAALQGVIALVCGEAQMLECWLRVDTAFAWRWPRPPSGGHIYRLVTKAPVIKPPHTHSVSGLWDPATGPEIDCLVTDRAPIRCTACPAGFWHWRGVASVGGSRCGGLIEVDRVQLQGLFEFCSARQSDGAAQWQGDLSACGFEPSLDKLLVALAANGVCESFFWQVCLALAQGLEAIMRNDGSDGPSKSQSSGSRPAFIQDEAPQRFTIAALNSLLAKHLYKTRALTMQHSHVLHLSMATDKSSVGGLPLHSSFMNVQGGAVVFPMIVQVSAASGVIEKIWGNQVIVFRVLSGDSFFLGPPRSHFFSSGRILGYHLVGGSSASGDSFFLVFRQISL